MAATYRPPGDIAGLAADIEALQQALAAIEAGTASGPAGGVLSGTYPGPGFAVNMATDAELAVVADALADEETARAGADSTHAALNTEAHNLAALLADAKARANHTGTQTSTTIADFTEAVQDAVAALLGAGSNITLNYNDASNTLEIVAAADGSGLDAEAVRDAIGIALVGAGLISVAVNDGADTITISTTATANVTDAALRDRSTHTGAQTIATVTGLQAALDAKVAETTRAASTKGFVSHGATAGTTRPTGYASIEWIGSVEPTNAANGDTWINTA